MFGEVWEAPALPQPVSHSGCPLLIGLASNLLQELGHCGPSIQLGHLQHEVGVIQGG